MLEPPHLGNEVVLTIEAVLTSTYNLCFRAKKEKDVYLCKPQFYYIKVGCKGAYITRTCLHDDLSRIMRNPATYMYICEDKGAD